MTLIDYWRRMSPVVLLLGFFCEPILGAPQLNREINESAETIAAASGVSPGLMNTAIFLLSQPGIELSGGTDKVLPMLGTIDSPRPMRPVPLIPAMNSNKPKPPFHQMYFPPMAVPPAIIDGSSAEQKYESQTASLLPAPVAPPTPLQPLDVTSPILPSESVGSATPLEVLAEEDDLLTPDDDGESSDDVFSQIENQVDDNSETVSSIVTPEISPVEEIISMDTTSDQHADSNFLPESFQTPYNPSQSMTTDPNGSQISQGNHQTMGSQHIGMNLNGTSAEFASTSNVHVEVNTTGTGSSTVHYIGSRVNPKPNSNYQHHQGSPSPNGVTKYLINFAKQTAS